MNIRPISSFCLPLALLAAGCSDGGPIELPGTSSVQSPEGWRYERGVTFVAREDAGPVAVPFGFATSPRTDLHEREARAWLARGETWDRFIEERWTAPPSPGVWRVVPPGDLRMGVAQTGDLEWLSFQSGERRLRVEMGTGPTGWQGGERERFRILPGTLTLGSESIDGFVMEEMEVRREAGAEASETVSDRLILLDSNGVALYLLHAHPAGAASEAGTGTSWVYAAGRDRTSQAATVEWVQVRPLEQGRRDIPLHWSFSAPEAGISGEITALGYDSVLGEERGGRREVEVRYTVEGWVERDGERVEVVGVVRHQQR